MRELSSQVSKRTVDTLMARLTDGGAEGATAAGGRRAGEGLVGETRGCAGVPGSTP